jgi:hypothetical protein
VIILNSSIPFLSDISVSTLDKNSFINSTDFQFIFNDYIEQNESAGLSFPKNFPDLGGINKPVDSTTLCNSFVSVTTYIIH